MKSKIAFYASTTVLLAFVVVATSAYADSQSVRVTNTNANPVPVNGNVVVSGTANVNITNPALPVSGVVGISGTPNVNIANTTPLAVTLSGAAGTAVEPALTPYFYEGAVTCPYLNVCYGTFPAVPTGKRLRVTSISVLGISQGSAVNPFLALKMSVASFPKLVFSVPIIQLVYYGGPGLFLSQPVDYYFDADQLPVLELGSSTSFSLSAGPITMTINGYLVSVAP